MYIPYTFSRHNGRRKHQFMRLGTKFKLRQFISISIVLQAQQDVLMRTNTKLDLYVQCINTCVQMLSPVLFNIHHTGTAGCSLRIHSKARKFIQHMRSKCANCSWMLMALKSLGKHKFWMVDIICLPTDIERYPIRKFSVHRPPKPCAALDLLAWLPRIFLKLETSCT